MVFQHPRHAQHFLECAEREAGARVDADTGTVNYNGHLTHVEAIPISVDFKTWDETSKSRASLRWITRLRRRFRLERRRVAVSVDRLDYTKGIPERLSGIDLFFRRYPHYRSRVVFIQKCAPSRTHIKAYRDLQKSVEERVAALNAQYGTDDWQPVVYLPQPIPPAAMAALFRMADLCVVSSLQDGMNLVAKEFIACQADGRGVLALSDLAGARDELLWAVSINPYDAEGFADVLARGLEMPVEERSDRMARLRTYVADRDVSHWMRQHFLTARRLIAGAAPGGQVLQHGPAGVPRR